MGCGFLHCEKLNFQERSDFELLVSGTKHEDGTLIANWSSNVSSGMKDATSWPESTCVGGLGPALIPLLLLPCISISWAYVHTTP